MATSYEIDALLAELAASLAPPQRAAFEAAAHAALEATGCSGISAAGRYRVEVEDAAHRRFLVTGDI
jgi:hypothetical protein